MEKSFSKVFLSATCIPTKDFAEMVNAHGKKHFPKSLTESFERIPFLDFGGRNANESGKGWSFITTQMNKMEFLPFRCLQEAQISSL